MIAIDIDGVIADSDPWLVKEIEYRSGIKLKFNKPRVYDFFINTNINVFDGIRYINDAIIKYKDDIKVYDYINTCKALQLIESKEGCVNFVTARATGRVAEATHWWIYKHFGELVYNIHSLDYNADKLKWMYNNNAYAIIEDRLKTVNIVSSLYDSYLINREWNINRYNNPRVKRFTNLLQAVEFYFNKNTEGCMINKKEKQQNIPKQCKQCKKDYCPLHCINYKEYKLWENRSI